MINMQSNDIPLYTPDGDYTLWGCYKLTCGYIHENYDWLAESTKIGHEGRLRRIIKLVVPDHDILSIDQYPVSFPEDVRNAIESRGKDVTGEDYEDSTLEQYEHIVRVVLEVAEAHYLRKPHPENEGASSNRLHFAHSSDPVVRRFLRPEEELALLKLIIPQLGASGPARLLLLMMACGFRENECCGLNWSMLRKNPTTEICTIIMPQSTNVGNNTPKLSGKNTNAMRQLVIPDLVYKLLMKAKESVLNDWIAAAKCPKQFDNIPLGGSTKDYAKRCATKDLTNYANKLFCAIGMRHHDLAALAYDLTSEYIERSENGLYADIEEYRSCTCYLLRRAYATGLISLNLNAIERQYSMGHKIEDPTVDRRIFTSSQMQEHMHGLIRHKPLVNILPSNQHVLEINQTRDFHCHAETIIVPPGASCIALDISTEEPGDTIEIDLKQDENTFSELLASYRISFSEPVPENTQYPDEINILYFYHQLYKEQISEFSEWVVNYL